MSRDGLRALCPRTGKRRRNAIPQSDLVAYVIILSVLVTAGVTWLFVHKTPEHLVTPPVVHSEACVPSKIRLQFKQIKAEVDKAAANPTLNPTGQLRAQLVLAGSAASQGLVLGKDCP